MSPYFSSYRSGVDREDFDLLIYLSVHILPFTQILISNNKDIRRKITTSTSWCHLAARAVATVFEDKGLKVVDGRVFDIMAESAGKDFALTCTTHSWCCTKNNSIMDVAPVGILSYMPILLARKDNVKTRDWGFVSDKYQETSEVHEEIREHLRSPTFREGFPVYVSVLKNARQRVDAELAESKPRRKTWRKNED
jgi:hypothetical protein